MSYRLFISNLGYIILKLNKIVAIDTHEIYNIAGQ